MSLRYKYANENTYYLKENTKDFFKKYIESRNKEKYMYKRMVIFFIILYIFIYFNRFILSKLAKHSRGWPEALFLNSCST